MEHRTVTLLGSTGSIGTQSIEVIQAHPELFTVYGLAAAGGNPQLLAEQAARQRPRVVAIADAEAEADLRRRLSALDAPYSREVEVLAGADAAAELAGRKVDVVLNGITGGVGLGPTLAALRANTTLALANKESLVVGGALVKAALRREGQIVPVDSEHSAIAQSLRGGRRAEVSRIILTASGGPFRGRKRGELENVTLTEALAHPTWDMGPVVTINSSTLVNKALELIEAHLLFDVAPDDIEVVVHPQSIVHSAVEFRDGALIAQASPPDMKLPIALGLSWPDRLDRVAKACDWTESALWTFEPLDQETFPAIGLARSALAASPLHPAVFNAANETFVAQFIAGRISYLDIVDTLTLVCSEFVSSVLPGSVPTLEQILDADRWARNRAEELLKE